MQKRPRYNSLENPIGIETLYVAPLPSLPPSSHNSLENPIGIETDIEAHKKVSVI